MPDWRKFLRLPADEKRLILSACVSVAKARAILWVVPFRYWRREVVKNDNLPGGPPSQNRREDAERVAGAVARVSRWVPGASCLTQAIATRWMLSRRGIESTLRIGVARDHVKGFQAHAWVEHAGEVIIGDRGVDLTEFVPLATDSPAKSHE